LNYTRVVPFAEDGSPAVACKNSPIAGGGSKLPGHGGFYGKLAAADGFETRDVPVDITTRIAELLIDVEAQLRQLGQWERSPPPPGALDSDQPFCVDTLTLPQWLQFVFLPTLYAMLEEGRSLPDRCGIAPMAEEFFSGTGPGSDALVATLVRIDELLTTDIQG